MTEIEQAAAAPGCKTALRRFLLAMLGLVAFVAVAITLEQRAGIPFKTSYRVVMAGFCLHFVAGYCREHRDERWARIGFLLVLLFDAGLFFSPLAHLPASKGDVLFFAVPDAAILFGARVFSYRPTSIEERAAHQRMIAGFIVALIFSAVILSMMFLPSGPRH